MKKSMFGALAILLVWALLTAGAWLLPANDISEAERRPLNQMPEITADSILEGDFMTDFESYTLDQFPLRDGFRQVKALFHYYALQQQDNNDIYVTDGYLVKQEAPLKESSVEHALNRFNAVYEQYLQNSSVYMTVVPDKGYYLAESSGHLTMDYEKLFAMMEQGMPWATHIDLTGSLTADSYYRLDTHWRQEALLPAAGLICDAMGVTAPKAEDFTATAVDRPFYGVYYGQAALPMEPDTMYLMESELLADCTVTVHDDNATAAVYDLPKLDNRDPYDVFLSGSKSLLTIENPNGTPGKELIVFRDSFGSSVAPLLVKDYAKVTLIDIRYIQIDVLDRFIPISGQDVLFLYSTLVLNNSETIK